MDFHYLGSAGAVPRCMESTPRHHFPFLASLLPYRHSMQKKTFYPFTSEENALSTKHLCLKLSIQPILRKAAVSNPKPEPVCKKLPFGL